jgi:two-component system, sensor histidine kinase and response regulator
LGSLESASPYGMVLLDVTLPDSDVTATVAAIRDGQAPRPRRLPVIGLVAGGSEHDRELCQRAGVDWHMDKPVHIAELRAVVKRWLEPAPEAPSPTRITAPRAAP